MRAAQSPPRAAPRRPALVGARLARRRLPEPRSATVPRAPTAVHRIRPTSPVAEATTAGDRDTVDHRDPDPTDRATTETVAPSLELGGSLTMFGPVSEPPADKLDWPLPKGSSDYYDLFDDGAAAGRATSGVQDPLVAGPWYFTETNSSR